MNCVKGDLVGYVGTECEAQNCRGWIGRTIEFRPGPSGSPAWIVEPPIDKTWRGNWIVDMALRPIRPGESKEESTEAMRLLTQVKEKA